MIRQALHSTGGDFSSAAAGGRSAELCWMSSRFYLVEGLPRECGNLVQVGAEEQKGGEARAADGVALGGRLGGVAHRILHSGDSALKHNALMVLPTASCTWVTAL